MLDTLSYVNSIPAQTTNNYPITVKPNQVLIIHGLARKTSFTTAVTKSANTMHSSSLLVSPRVVSLESPGKTTRVSIRICNLSAKMIKIPPRPSLCMLNEVKVFDSWQPKPSKTFVGGEDAINSLEDLAIKINYESLTSEHSSNPIELSYPIPTGNV